MFYEPLQEVEDEPQASQKALGAASAASSTEFPDPFGPEAREERLSSLMLEVFNGEVGRGRPLKYWENLKLRPQHIQMIVMKGAGYKNRTIAERFGMTEARVSVILNHPDSLSILSRLVSFQAENLLDIKARVQAHAGEALDTVLTAMRTATEPAVKAKIGFSLLDRAGYGAVQKVEQTHHFEMPATQATALTEALRESQSVEDADYTILDPAAVTAVGPGEPPNEEELSVGSEPTFDTAMPPRGEQQSHALEHVA